MNNQMQYYEMFENDTQTIISDITETPENNTVNSLNHNQKLQEMREQCEIILNNLTIDILKDKCKELKINGISKLKKPELVKLINDKYVILEIVIQSKKINELRVLLKHYTIKYTTSIKKNDLCIMLLNHCLINLIFIDETPILIPLIEPNKTETVSSNEIKLSLIEQLEKQKNEIELKMNIEIKKEQKQNELEKIRLEKEQTILEEKMKKEREQILLKEKEQKISEEIIKKDETKKKKQSIPKNIRIIIWNHYIGEDIIKHRCLCCKKVLILITNFEVGHVISETNGGTHEINNLRPICFACNHSMGTENMIEFVVKYGLYIG